MDTPARNACARDHHYGPLERSHAEYQGRPPIATAKLAFFQLGQVSLELIESIGDPSSWKDQLDNHGQSLHHIAFDVKRMKERFTVLAEQGLPLIQKVEYEGGCYADMDGQKKLGAVIEFLEND